MKQQENEILSHLNHLVILDLVSKGFQDASAISRILKDKNISHLEYANISKILNFLAKSNENNISYLKPTSDNSGYELTTHGDERLKKLKKDFNHLSDLINNDTLSFTVHDSDSIISIDTLFSTCSQVKTIPYSISHFFENDIKGDDNDWFLNYLPNQGEYKYTFEGRGLGDNTFEDTIVLFVNSGYVFFVAQIAFYEHSTKTMHLKAGSIFKLKTPLSKEDFQNNGFKDFKFIRNKQTFTDSTQIESIKEMLKTHH